MNVNYVSNPSINGRVWFVWNMYSWPAGVVFTGTMEECGQVSDALNADRWAR